MKIYKKVKNKNILLFFFMITLSFISWKLELIWAGGDSGYYFVYSNYVTNYFNSGFFDLDINPEKYIENKTLQMILNDNFWDKNTFFRLNETFSYIFLSAYLNHIFSSSIAIILFQSILIFITINEIKKILFIYNQKFTLNFYILVALLPIILISIFPLKESITIFFSTFLFRLYLDKKRILFIVIWIFFYLFRWNLAILFLGFLISFYLSNKILNSKFNRYYNILLFFVIVLVFLVGTNFIEYFDSGYKEWTIKMSISSIVFPLIKFGHYDEWNISNILFGIWNNIYSIVWYFFLPAFFLSLFVKTNFKALGCSLLVILVFYGTISSGNQIDRIKLEFYPIYLILGIIIFRSIKNKRKYFYFFLFFMFFNFLQATNYSLNKINDSSKIFEIKE